ncbi:MAG TPA: T9SS type A sorting domain-containing protein, partial [Bacteroidia bacterium]|nr:T9SS type A sorting domain-containing protein [Bacteroidia bacterium]
DIANVRARIMNGGDMWWDAVTQTGPKYEVPIGSGKHSLFSGAIWIGGLDASNQLHVAAQTYRQSGTDFWPGPCGSDSSTCLLYDRVWKINKQDVINFIAGAPATPDMISYPGNYPNGQPLAPFVDVDGNGIYNSAAGDYPDFGLSGSPNCCDILHGDQAIWWVINETGNNHTETGGASFGLEIQCQAFAFNSTDADLNNTTFYQYKIKNCSSISFHDVYFGLWADADLGNYLDDYVGCDVPRGMGYVYNGDSIDEGPTGYGLHPPALGIDFLQGPLADLNDGVDNNRNCIIDEAGEDIIMSKFVYYENSFSFWGNPSVATDYYNYLKGNWLNNQVMTYGGAGNGTGSGATNIPCNFMFPGNSDHQYEWGTGGNCLAPAAPQADWGEYIAGNAPFDRRMLLSVGPFTLVPSGMVNCITLAAIWVRDTNSTSPYSLAALQLADDKIQLFFDSCYHYGSLGIQEQENIYATVYPNPVSDILEINFGKNISDGKFILYDIFGKAIREVGVKNKTAIKVSCKEFAAGIYVYRIILADGQTGSGKVVIK